jgi:hypothetical protein
MTIVLPALAAAFGAFCVWLTVQIVNRRERWAIWTLAGTLISGCLMAFVTSRLAVRHMRQQVQKEFEEQQLRNATVKPPASNPDAES